MKLKTVLLILLLPLLYVREGTNAQADEPGPTYVIQPGDTITSIAGRFGIWADAVISANALTNPDSIQAGDRIELPGVTWVSGVLDRRAVEFGETLRTLTRRYQVSPLIFSRLNGAVSPGQVFVGYPAMLPTETGERLGGERIAVRSGESLLEAGIRAGVNPWALAVANRIGGAAGLLPGDVLLVPGSVGSGPGALPSPISQLSLSPLPLVQGKTIVIRAAANGEPLEIGGTLVDKTLHFYDQPDGSLAAMQGIHALLPEGLYPFSVAGRLADGSSFSYQQLVAVRSGRYDSERITVSENYLDDQQSLRENELVEGLVAEFTPEKLWSGLFILPTPYGDVINSYFGTRRSYNGSPYDYFHTGVDWGGGEGTPVLAPAAGIVVFAGLLEVRGNATIIDHGWGVYTGYWHQSRLDVEVGDVVSPGEAIGVVGNTGRSTGAHLHWEIWVGGVQVEPLDWLYQTYP
ncbi:MAG: peptidoglycan DD-metalloendopeptidase family protein [Chloroflexi bacterium]|nr:peptidoglycan DD-metalloendopeptidase family protein [Chloroflexota bacterium]